MRSLQSGLAALFRGCLRPVAELIGRAGQRCRAARRQGEGSIRKTTPNPHPFSRRLPLHSPPLCTQHLAAQNEPPGEHGMNTRNEFRSIPLRDLPRWSKCLGVNHELLQAKTIKHCRPECYSTEYGIWNAECGMNYSKPTPASRNPSPTPAVACRAEKPLMTCAQPFSYVYIYIYNILAHALSQS